MIKIPTWGYHASEKPKIFHLAKGETLPDGWSDSPAKVKADRHPFDHDGDGRPGGSLPKSKRGRKKG